MPRVGSLRDQVLARRLAEAKRRNIAEQLTADWTPQQRAAGDDDSLLIDILAGRRAGKTRLLCAMMVRDALETPGGRFLYLNSTRGEAERLAWHGNRDDGMASLNDRLRLGAKADASKLTLRFPNGAWIYLRGADDEAEMRKALGGAYHKVIFDEAQKIPPKLNTTIQEVFMPTLLDFGGQLVISGSPSRQMSGLFYQVSQPDVTARPSGWSHHHWTLLDNPFFGATYEERYAKGISGLQKLYGGADIDSPIMQREAFGKWVREDAANVYYVHKVPELELLYAPTRMLESGFPDVPTALKDLPWDWKGAHFAMGVDIGFNPDPFAMVLWGWHPHDPNLYEVFSWKRTHLTDKDQYEAIKSIREQVAIGVIAADVGGPVTPMGKGWSADFVTRYGVPIMEAEKHHKYEAIQALNSDIVRRTIKLRRDGSLFEEMSALQWSRLMSGAGKLVEDPTMQNHCADAALYAHRMSYQYRWKPEDKLPPKGTRERYERERMELEQEIFDS